MKVSETSDTHKKTCNAHWARAFLRTVNMAYNLLSALQIKASADSPTNSPANLTYDGRSEPSDWHRRESEDSETLGAGVVVLIAVLI